MGTTRKVVISLGIAGGALLAAWLLTGDRKKKTKEFISRKAGNLRHSFKKVGSTTSTTDDVDATYV